MLRLHKRPYQYCFSGNAIRYQLFSSEAVADGAVYFQVRVLFSFDHTTAPDTEIIKFDLTPVQGYASFDLQEILSAQLECSMPVMGATLKDATICEKQTGVFYIQFRQILSALPDPPFDNSEVDYLRRIIKGGLPVLRMQGNNFWKNYFFQYSFTPFLTWQHNGRLAQMTERMFIAWFNTSNTAADKIRATLKAVFTDGTESILHHSMIVPKHKIALIPAGALQWNLTTIAAAKKIYYWQLRVEDFTDPANIQFLSESFQYYADNRNDYNQKFLHYRNSLGGLDSVSVRGLIDKTLSHTYQEVEKAGSNNYYTGDTVNGFRSMENGKEQITYKGDIGHLYKDEQDRLRDALIKREAWQFLYGKFYPVLIVNKDFTLNRSNDKRFPFPLEWTPAINGDTAYCPESIDLGTGEDETAEICDCVISNWTYDKAFNVDDTICTIAHNFSIICSDEDEPATKAQWRVPGYVDTWQDFDLINLPLVTTHPAGITMSFELRPLCVDGIAGIVSMKPINTNVGSGGAYNSKVRNQTQSGGMVELYINNVNIFKTFIGAGDDFSFDRIDTADAEVFVIAWIPLTFAQLNSNAVIYPGNVIGQVVIFQHINIINGFTISLA